MVLVLSGIEDHQARKTDRVSRAAPLLYQGSRIKSSLTLCVAWLGSSASAVQCSDSTRLSRELSMVMLIARLRSIHTVMLSSPQP